MSIKDKIPRVWEGRELEYFLRALADAIDGASDDTDAGRSAVAIVGLLKDAIRNIEDLKRSANQIRIKEQQVDRQTDQIRYLMAKITDLEKRIKDIEGEF